MIEANRFEALRQLKGLNQVEMARLAGVSRSSWQRYERGEQPTGDVLQNLAKQGVNLHWLLTGHGQMMIGEPSAFPAEGEPAPSVDTAGDIDDELMARVVDTIARAYKDAGVALAPMDLGRLAGMHYRRISRTNVSGSPLLWDETLAMLRFLRISILDDLRKGGAANANSKALDGG